MTLNIMFIKGKYNKWFFYLNFYAVNRKGILYDITLLASYYLLDNMSIVIKYYNVMYSDVLYYITSVFLSIVRA